MKICFRCKKKIEKNSHYYTFTELNKGKEIKIDYVHKNCWDDWLKKLSSLEKAQNILNRVNVTPLVNMGLMKPEEIIIQ